MTIRSFDLAPKFCGYDLAPKSRHGTTSPDAEPKGGFCMLHRFKVFPLSSDSYADRAAGVVCVPLDSRAASPFLSDEDESGYACAITAGREENGVVY